MNFLKNLTDFFYYLISLASEKAPLLINRLKFLVAKLSVKLFIRKDFLQYTQHQIQHLLVLFRLALSPWLSVAGDF